MSRPLTLLARLNVVTHLAGLALAALVMRPGTPLEPLADRMRFLADSPAGWMLGWATWALCAMSLIAFLAVLAHQLGEGAFLARLGLVFGVVAIGFDLFCDSTYIIAFPRFAAGPESTFLAVEQLTGIISLVIANGFYTTAVLLTTLELRSRPGSSRATIVVGFGVVVFGALLAGAGFTGVAWHVVAATGPTMLLFCAWVILVARDLEPAGASE